jgi:hypothetical protein
MILLAAAPWTSCIEVLCRSRAKNEAGATTSECTADRICVGAKTNIPVKVIMIRG